MTVQELETQFEIVRTFQQSAHIKECKAEALRLSAMGGAIVYDKPNVQTSPQCYQDRAIADAVDLEREAKELRQRGMDLKDKLYALTKKLDSDAHQAILIYYYFDGLSVYDISAKLYVSRSNIYNEKSAALLELADKIP